MAGINYKHLDPFIMMDHMGEVDYAAGEPRGTNWHPHRGFETVTYLIDGQFIHQDTHGGGGVIREGSTQWMTAGAGLLHIETPPEKLVEHGGLFNGFQLWVNLPAGEKFTDAGLPAGRALGPAAARQRGRRRAAARHRRSRSDGHAGPGSTHTPITLLHASVAAGAQLSLPWQPTYNALAYVYAGRERSGPRTADPRRPARRVRAGDRVTSPRMPSRTAGRARSR